MRNRKFIIIFAVILIISSFIYLVSLGMKEGSMYYLEVSEFFDRLDGLGQGKVRVNGEIVPGSVDYDSSTMKLSFLLKDMDIENSPVLKVMYKGSPPDMLEQEGVTLVAEGSYNRAIDLFEAKKLLVKCPSKYEMKEDEA